VAGVFDLVVQLADQLCRKHHQVLQSRVGLGMVPNQLAILVPSFDPSKDDIDIWTRKIDLLVHAWPDGKITELW